jgi:hypothetical protein
MRAFNGKLDTCPPSYIKAYCALCLGERFQEEKRVKAREEKKRRRCK